jgi:transposase-like protein
MVRPGREPLTGDVEVDETFVGGREEGGGRRHIGKKALVAVAAEVRGRGTGRLRLRRIQDSSARSILPFVKESVAPGSLVITDGLPTYRALPSLGYRHEKRLILEEKKRAVELQPRVHRVASLLKRWLLGTHQGSVSREHLDDYLNEFTFRFNRRTSAHRGKLFFRLVEQAMVLEPTPYQAIVKRVREGRRKGTPKP